VSELLLNAVLIVVTMTILLRRDARGLRVAHARRREIERGGYRRSAGS